MRVFTGRDTRGKRSYVDQTVHGTRWTADQELRKLLAKASHNLRCRAFCFHWHEVNPQTPPCG